MNFYTIYNNLYFNTKEERAKYCLLAAIKLSHEMLDMGILELKDKLDWDIGQTVEQEYKIEFEIKQYEFYNKFNNIFDNKYWNDREINTFIFKNFIQEFLYHYMGSDKGKLDFLTSIKEARKNAMKYFNYNFIDILNRFSNLKDNQEITFFGTPYDEDGCNIALFQKRNL